MAGVPQSHGCFLFELPSPNFPQRIEFGQLGWICGLQNWVLIGVARSPCVGRVLGVRPRQYFGATVPLWGSPLSDCAHQRSIHVVGITSEGGIGQPHRRVVGTGRLGLPRKRRQCGRLASNHAPSQLQPFSPQEGQKHAIAGTGIAKEFFQKSVFRTGRGCRNLERYQFHARRRGRGGGVDSKAIGQMHLKASTFKRAFDQYDRITIAPQRRESRGEHSQSGTSNLAGEHHIFGPCHGHNGQRTDYAARISGRDRFVWHHQHAPGGTGNGR